MSDELQKGEEMIDIVFSDGGYQSKVQIPANLQAVDKSGEIVNISTKKIAEKLTLVVATIQTVSKFAMDKANEIVSGGPDGPSFRLDEIVVGLNVSVEAGVVVAGVGAEGNLELRFSRTDRRPPIP